MLKSLARKLPAVGLIEWLRGMFEIRYTPEAIADLSSYDSRDRRRIMDQIDACLQHEPECETRNNKVLRPKPTGREGTADRPLPSLLRHRRGKVRCKDRSDRA